MTLPSEVLDGGDAFFGRLGKPVSQILLWILQIGEPSFLHSLLDHHRSPAFQHSPLWLIPETRSASCGATDGAAC